VGTAEKAKGKKSGARARVERVCLERQQKWQRAERYNKAGGMPADNKSNFSKEFVIPPDFPEILRGLTREVLRSQPKDINAFAYEYFKKMKEDIALTQATGDDF
jgi:hypothetical protein